jgi:hypothetical protein
VWVSERETVVERCRCVRPNPCAHDSVPLGAAAAAAAASAIVVASTGTHQRQRHTDPAIVIMAAKSKESNEGC